ncbi:MAG TPA: pyridoxamine 5'-phosphate oxidase family protein [Candidatus Cloacimonadota bacterium]|nr:pyridoxamine 5'-phosphate oxidase family protein [Candidatus Cloacimonadota bacterium]
MARTSDSELMQEILTWIRQNQYVYLATVDKNQARVRPIVMFEYDERYFFTTYSGDAKVGQIHANKRVEVCVPISEDGQNGYVRLMGSAKIVTNNDLRAEAAEYCYFFDQYYSGWDDPDYTLIEFYPEYAEYLRPGENHSRGCTFRRY